MSIVGKGFRALGCLIKLFFGLLVFVVVGFLLWRIFSANTPDELTALSVNDSIYEAYEESDGDLYMFQQGQSTITRAPNTRGYFSVTHAMFIPDANQIQIVFRYNNSTLEHLVRDKELDAIPDRSENVYDVTLFCAVDLTPDNLEDNPWISDEGTRTFRCTGELVESMEESLYNYRKYVFDFDECDEDIRELLDSGLLLVVYADVYYVGDLDYEEDPYGALCLYDYKTKIKEVKLSREECKAIENWGK